MVKSEHGSPVVSPTANLGQWNDLLPPLDISRVSPDHIPGMDGFSNMPDHDQPLFSAGLSVASVDWSHYDGLEFNNDDFAPSSYSQPPSFTGFDFNSIDQPALTTTSTSGEISEVEDFVSLGDPVTAQLDLMINNKYGSDFDTSEIGGEIDGYRLSTASSYVGLPQVQMLAGNNAEALDLETFLKSNAASNMYLDTDQPLATTAMTESSKMVPDTSCFDENTNFPLLSGDGDNDTFWMNDFASSGIPINSGYGELPEENIWAQ